MRSTDRYALLACAVAALLASLVYVNALNNPFVYDDYRTILSNGSILRLGDWHAVFFRDITRPFTNLSFAIDRAIWGAQPFGFHLTNVVLHVLNVAVLFAIGKHLVEDFNAAHDAGFRNSPVVVAFAAAALLAVHPMMTESVGYISGRSDLLCATFFLLAFLAARRWMLVGGAWWAVLAVVLWAMSLLTKELGPMWPFVLLAYDRWILGRAHDDRRRARNIFYGAMIGLGAIVAAARVTVLLRVEHGAGVQIQLSDFLQQLDVIRRYVVLLLIPAGQSVFHAIPAVKSLFELRALAGISVVAIFLIVAWRLRRVDGPAGFGLLWFLLLLVPSSALVVLRQGDAMAEHRTYLASAGLFLTVGTAVSWVGLHVLTRPPIRALAGVGLAAVLLSLAGRTVLRNAIWSDPISLWTEAVNISPHDPLPRTVLGESLHAANRHEEAIASYRQAMALDPDEASIYLKLGICLAELGRTDEANKVFETLRQRAPDSTMATTGLGVVAMLSGQPVIAGQRFRESMAKAPADIMSRQWLAVLEEDVNKNYPEALRLCESLQTVLPWDSGNDDCIRRNRARVTNDGRD